MLLLALSPHSRVVVLIRCRIGSLTVDGEEFDELEPRMASVEREGSRERERERDRERDSRERERENERDYWDREFNRDRSSKDRERDLEWERERAREWERERERDWDREFDWDQGKFNCLTLLFDFNVFEYVQKAIYKYCQSNYLVSKHIPSNLC